LALCRPFFRKTIFHWHAIGLGDWVAAPSSSRMEHLAKVVTKRVLNRNQLSLVLSPRVEASVRVFNPQRVAIFPNAIPDPCPNFERSTPKARIKSDSDVSSGGDPTHQLLFMGHCIEEKGLYDAAEAVILANRSNDGNQLNRSHKYTLIVSGQFLSKSEEEAFRSRYAGNNAIRYVGFVSGERKDQLLRESACLLFPTFYKNEVMPILLIEALAYSLPVITTQWRAIPDLCPSEGPFWMVQPHQPQTIADLIGVAVSVRDTSSLRKHFLANFCIEGYGRRFLEILNAAEAKD
jgi:glycosyltransferase involved in cell wall biosynthesis